MRAPCRDLPASSGRRPSRMECIPSRLISGGSTVRIRRRSEGSDMTGVRRIEVPDRARALAHLDRVDYADCFEVDVAAERTPIAWVRLCVEQMPSLFNAVRVAHRALGLRLAHDDANHVFGWE